MRDRVALVTGGVRGIGAAISRKFLELGAQVIVIATNEERNKKWVAAQQEAGFTKVAAYVCDVADFAACAQVVAEIKANFGHIDILVNNAGVTKDLTLKKMSKEDWDRVLRIDLDSVFNLTRNVIEDMLENKFGRIINISSVNGQKGQFGQTNYAAAKAGMHGFTKSLALETAKKGVTVNTVSPGYIATDMMKDIPEDIMQGIIGQIPAARLGTPEEVAELVAFLASDNAGYITGADLSINGGLHMS